MFLLEDFFVFFYLRFPAYFLFIGINYSKWNETCYSNTNEVYQGNAHFILFYYFITPFLCVIKD